MSEKFGPRNEEDQNKIEIERLPDFPVLVTGGGHGTGEAFVKRLAREGLTVYVGTRTPEHFQKIQESVREAGGRAVQPFFADVTDPQQVDTAYRTAGFLEGQPVHYFPLAAAGYEKLGRAVMRPLVGLRRGYESGQLTQEFAEQITDQIRAAVSTEAAMALANATNRDAVIGLGRKLEENGNLREGSVIGTLSSMMSDTAVSGHPELYPGPWLYFPIAQSKADGVKGLGDIALRTGAKHIDSVAGAIDGTDVGNFFGGMQGIFEELHRISGQNDEFKFPSVGLGEVADSMYREVSRKDPSLPQIRKVYILGNGITSPNRPKGWDKPAIPYL